MKNLNSWFSNILNSSQDISKKVKSYKYAFWLMLLSAINPGYANNWENLQDQNSQQYISNQLDLAWIIANSVDNNIDVKVDKEKFLKIYYQFENKKWLENFNSYFNEFLLKAFLNLIEEWYEIKWHKELDEITKIIKNLTNNEVKITYWSSLPENSEFSETLIVEWKIKSWELKLEKEWSMDKFMRNISNNDVDVNLNLSNLMNIFFNDLPKSLDSAISKLIETNNQLIKSEALNRDLNNQINSKDYQIKTLKEEIDKTVLEYETQLEELKKQFTSEKDELTDSHKKLILNLEEKHKSEINTKLNEINSKDKEIEELKNNHQKNIKELNDKHLEELKRLEDKHNWNLIDIKNDNQLKIEEKNKKISDLEKEIENLREVNKSQKEVFEATIKNLRVEINASNLKNNDLSNLITNKEVIISELNKEITKLKKDIESKSDQIKNLVNDKSQLNNQIWTIDWLKDSLMSEAQQNLVEAQKLNSTYQARIDELQLEIDKNNKRIIELEKYLTKYNQALIENKTLRDNLEEAKKLISSIPQKDTQINELSKQVKELADLNQKLNNVLNLNKELSAENEILLKDNKNVDSLRESVKKLNDEINYLRDENKRKDERLISESKRISQLWQQIELINSKHQELIKTKSNISNSKLIAELWELNSNYKKLVEKFNLIDKQNQSLLDENSRLKKQLADALTKNSQIEDRLKKEYQRKLADIIKEKFWSKN